MHAVVLENYGPPDVLHLAEVAAPEPGHGQIKIEVAAAGVNPADVKWRAGALRLYSELNFPQILGYDVAGIVAATGDAVSGFAVGDRVVAMLDHGVKGGYAEYAVAAADACAQLPDGIDFALAAAIPTPGHTGMQLIEAHVRPRQGERILITGACGAVGRFAVHAALKLGAHVVAGVRERQRPMARELGASEIVAIDADYAGPPFDHVADTVGGPAVAALCCRVRPQGRIRTVSTTPIAAEGLPSLPEFVALRADARELAQLVAAVLHGEIRYKVVSRLPLARAPEAHRLMEAGGLGGKIVLET